jgi:hypothetical protein
LLLGRSFYNIYVREIRSPLTVAVAWLSLAFIIVIWTLYPPWRVT